MDRCDIHCHECGKFILAEEKDEYNNIHCVAGSYDDGYYVGEDDVFFCKECADRLKLEQNAQKKDMTL